MVRCDEFYEKWRKMGNFCEKHPKTAAAIDKYLEFIDEIENREDITPEVKERMLEMSERAAYPIMQKKNADIKEKVILDLEKDLTGENQYATFIKSRTPTVRDVERLIAIERGEKVKPNKKVLKPETIDEAESEAIIVDYIKNMDPKVKQKQIELIKELAEDIKKSEEEEINMSKELKDKRKESQDAFRNWTRIARLLADANIAKCPICNSRGNNLYWMCEGHEPISIFESDKRQKERMAKLEEEYKELEGAET